MDSDAITLIKNDHRLLEGLLDQLKAGTGDRLALLEEVAARLDAHSLAEEQKVYPAIADADPDERDEVNHAYHEHHEVEHLLRKLTNVVESPKFDQVLTQFVDAVNHHVQGEENEVLPALRKAVDKTTLRRLGQAFEETRIAELRDAGFDPESGTGAQQSATDAQSSDDLADATREELYEMAKKAGLSHRSTMSKDELIQALRDRS